jgi:predicted lysophospholipase L1 biosynthesis ABC-type transport system permease subunit
VPATAALIVALSVVVTTLVGFAGTFRILGRKAAPYLRNE